MDWLAGTSGYSYKEWKGSFYPAQLKAEDWLGYYASRLPAVEINNTFYRMPRAHVVEEWAAAVPAGFRFVLKASRRITHQLRLNNADEPTAYLIKRVALLEDKLGAVLFQLPPFLRKDLPRLQRFLEAWPSELPAAMEFRHASWFDEEVFDTLRQHGIALCLSDDEKLTLPAQFATCDWLYLRLRAPGYTSQKLAGWIRRAKATSADRGFAFFKHEDDGAGPLLAEKFLRLASAPEPRRAAARTRRRASRQA